ncbi:undecaprenyldiphospho-muramoylpentapeptide beta-N-acetylglucosaminyltransferase [Armatimonas rosea]|uniref:UDP-N-acetylglucosamine--N-acetylmuramyl-(pentapeptide) pyrophosphoryl-undecaprenol N-acetylglucosamine transferase n=1 Tax=Armatimonas rosea TaxID=685828 RepID=A0A7W9SUK4_ARMRO|nr:undecaprenyldiphospho-muramoylpentapeptide beta-N-acetylglucosaminyltransferase [Armatimonas rosea]MBB6053105.1 UDP-N-acetylglucosamine--N-acetylmuramyl-(pentapeptide) pyrophosphoryl-undecaprenol N-acetylglucosamine transferase [Armatimonas rosea]
MRVLVTGGGTGGHVSPALAVIQALQKREPGIVIRYVGSATGVEAKLAREAGLEFVGVASGKLRRSSKGPLGLLTGANLRDAFRVPQGFFQALKAVKDFKPDVVFATGGYVSVPAVLAAASLRIPILTHEQTVTVGLANKINGRYAKRIALSFEGAKEELPPALQKKAFVTGNPVREVIFAGSKNSAASRFGFDGVDECLPCIYVTGGAQGSRILNNAVKDALPTLLTQARVLHQCGESDIEALEAYRKTLTDRERSRWVVRAFVQSDEIGDAYALANLLVSRSGAGTVTEVCALGKPAIFVPLVPTSGDEQTRNAQRLVDAGAALLIKQSECSGESLLAAILPLLDDASRRASLGGKAKKLATPRAAEDLADAIFALGKK